MRCRNGKQTNSGLNEGRTSFVSDACEAAPAESACLAQGVVQWHLWLVLGGAKPAPPGRQVIMKLGTPALLKSTGMQCAVLSWTARQHAECHCAEKLWEERPEDLDPGRMSLSSSFLRFVGGQVQTNPSCPALAPIKARSVSIVHLEKARLPARAALSYSVLG